MTGTLSVLSNYCCCYRCYNVTFISESRAPEHKVQLFTAHFCLDDTSALQTNPFTINFSIVSAKLLFLFCRVDDSIITLLCVCVCVHAKSLQSCRTLCDAMDCSLPGTCSCHQNSSLISNI